jgi:alkylation response protein AidB-like acyl-CoA dehydrogenase
MNLLLSGEQTQIVDSLKDFLIDRAPVSRFRPPAPQIGNSDEQFWPQLGELGFLGISLSESQGGIGFTAAEEMLAYREFGRHLLSPAVLGLTIGAQIAAKAGSGLLDEMLLGRMSVGLANPRGPTKLGAECSGEFHLFDAKNAAWVLVCGETGAALLRRADFIEVSEVQGTDHVIGLERARLADASPGIWVESGAEPVYSRAQLLIAAYATGIAEATRDMAVEYAKTRQQFGKPIGSFQAIKHICADMAIRAEAALCQVIFAALVQAEQGAGADFHSCAAKLVSVDAALRNAAQNIQVHGAIGFTAEADAHSFIKRSHLIEQLWGDTRQHRRQMLTAAFPDETKEA